MTGSPQHIPEEMVRAGAIALNGGHERHALDRWEREVRCVLEGALAGRAVIDLPEPDDSNDTLGGLAEWSLPNDTIGIDQDIPGRPVYSEAIGAHLSVDEALAEGAALIAAARTARRLAT